MLAEDVGQVEVITVMAAEALAAAEVLALLELLIQAAVAVEEMMVMPLVVQGDLVL